MKNPSVKRVLRVFLIILVIANLALLGVIIYYRWIKKPDCNVAIPVTPSISETIDCDYERELTDGEVKRLVRIVGVKREGDNGFVVIERKKDGTWIKEEIFMGKSGDGTQRLVEYTDEPYDRAEDAGMHELLAPDQMYEAVSTRIGKEAYIYVNKEDRELVGAKEYLSLDTITFLEK